MDTIISTSGAVPGEPIVQIYPSKKKTPAKWQGLIINAVSLQVTLSCITAALAYRHSPRPDLLLTVWRDDPPYEHWQRHSNP